MTPRDRKGLAEALVQAFESGGPLAGPVDPGDGILVARRERCEAALAALRAAPVPDDASALDRGLRAFAVAFDHELFFEAHEILEPEWREANGALRSGLQGLIQIAVGFEHHRDGNRRGAVSLLEEGRKRLDAAPIDLPGLRIDELRSAAARWARAIHDGEVAGLEFPNLIVRPGGGTTRCRH